MKKIYWLLIIIMMLAGCSILSPVAVDTQNKYVINTLPTVPKKPRRQITLIVARPDTNSTYNTRQMAYSVRPYQIAYFAKNIWISVPAEMIHPLIVQTLQKTQHFHAVIAPPVSGRYDYILQTQIEELLQDYTYHSAVLHLTVRAEIIRASNGRVVATKQIVINQPIQQVTPLGGVYAANQATASMLRELARFCLKNI